MIISNTGAVEKKTGEKTYLLPLGGVKIISFRVRAATSGRRLSTAATRSAEIQAVAIREGELNAAIALSVLSSRPWLGLFYAFNRLR